MPKFFEENEFERELGCLECGEIHFKSSHVPGLCQKCYSYNSVSDMNTVTDDDGWDYGWEES